MMKDDTILKLSSLLNSIDDTILKLSSLLNSIDEAILNTVCAIIAGICTVIALPFMLIYEGCKLARYKIKGMVQDESTREWVTKEEIAYKELMKRVWNREIPLMEENHVPTKKDGDFLFFEKRKLSVPLDHFVYVETEYSEKLHRFFEENAEWLDTWQQWHGYDIVEYDYDDIKEGMLYPQDFAVFRHGLLRSTGYSHYLMDKGQLANVFKYYEIDPDSDIPIKEQFEDIMTDIYRRL